MQRPSSNGALPFSSQPPLVTRSLQLNVYDGIQCNQPCRPHSTPVQSRNYSFVVSLDTDNVIPQKPRIQRFLLGPDQHVTQEKTFKGQLRAFQLSKRIRWPHSPPRFLSVEPMDSNESQSSDVASEIEHVLSPTNTNIVHNNSVLLAASKAGNGPSDLGKHRHYSQSSQVFPPSTHNKEFFDQHPLYDPHPLNQEFDIVNTDESDTRIFKPRVYDIETSENAVKENMEQSTADHNDYKQALTNRRRLLSDEANRQRIRDDLEFYVDSLKSLMDEDGEQLVLFPPNYQQVVSLMTRKDINEEAMASKEGKGTHQNWSRVLVEAGLSKQQAFGTIEEDPEARSNLAAKIALKMARIRQLDTILEKKLGKNLYANDVQRKQIASQHKEMKENSILLSVTQAQSATSSVTLHSHNTRQSCATSDIAKKGNNFIERNKQIVANGMNANMTKQEEERLEMLFRDDVSQCDGPQSDDNAGNEVKALYQERNEYTMTDEEKIAIEKLISTQSVNHPLYGIDGLPLDDSARNIIIQETRGRLQRQRLSRVEQELRFLRESPSVIIVGDNRDEDELDDCRSEQSFATATSSMCSARSGVISRHDFKRFLAFQKKTFHSTPIASADTIRQLLLSIDHGKLDVMSATTG